MDNPCAYLFTIAKVTIMSYCMEHTSLITKSRYSQQPNPSTGSLNTPIYPDSEIMLLDCLTAPEPEEESEAQDYTRLYQALDTLPERDREVLTRHYGLQGRPAESLYQLSREISANPGPKSSAAYLIEYRALARLRRQFGSIA